MATALSQAVDALPLNEGSSAPAGVPMQPPTLSPTVIGSPLKRKLVHQKYAELIESMYSSRA